MPTRSNPVTLEGNRVHLRQPRRTDQRSFIAYAKQSRALHRGWVQAPETPTAFAAYVARYHPADAAPRNVGFLVIRNEDDAIVGVINFSEIIRGAFHSGYVGYYAFAPFAGVGYMAEGFALALDFAFRKMKLHRIEANVQPANIGSLALVERLGFIREGYSRRYVKIAGRWRDHVRFAMLAEDWKEHRVELRGRRAATRGA
ncbi:MAG TPA: GNAT family N-acetyltransferase [Casimicrobiaceae bacterium]|jgi:ribosomal-protein-alanine N-acetyltransferase|nr:GNAT family N-acetyltransferase [Casimicrobiaceae bacterium]